MKNRNGMTNPVSSHEQPDDPKVHGYKTAHLSAEFDSKRGALVRTEKVRNDTVHSLSSLRANPCASSLNSNKRAYTLLKQWADEGVVAITISLESYWSGDSWNEQSVRLYNRIPSEDDLTWSKRRWSDRDWRDRRDDNRASNMRSIAWVLSIPQETWDAAADEQAVANEARRLKNIENDISRLERHIKDARAALKTMAQCDDELTRIPEDCTLAIEVMQSKARGAQHAYNRAVSDAVWPVESLERSVKDTDDIEVPEFNFERIEVE